MMSHKNPLVFQTAFGQFTEKRLIGNGGAGRVYECTDREGAVWAIKVLDPARTTSEKLRRFKNEFNFCLRHPHPKIVGVTDSGVVDLDGAKMPFFVMPYFAGSLRSLLDGGQVSADVVLKFYDQILSGVEAAHLWKVVHRDLKPENILYDPVDARLVVADFGIAQFAADGLFTVVDTGPATRLASFLYAAPEQRVKGRQVDHRADIYALGLILNEMFTGEVPHGTAYRKISSVAPQYAYLDDLVDQMLRQMPDERPASVKVIKADLIGRGLAFVQVQELDALRKTVVPTRDVTDPLIENPVQLVGATWENEVLTLKLSQPVNDKWLWSLGNMGGYSAPARQPPQAFAFRGNEGQVRASEAEVQAVINTFKSWLPRANQVYASRVKKEAMDAEESERAALRARVAAAEVKERVNRSIKI